jgi:hypothetical protein
LYNSSTRSLAMSQREIKGASPSDIFGCFFISILIKSLRNQ